MVNLSIVDEAEDEIEHARSYLAERSASAPDTFLAEVRHVLGLIADTPELWPEYDDRYRFFALRKHSYVVYYEILDAETVRCPGSVVIGLFGVGRFVKGDEFWGKTSRCPAGFPVGWLSGV